MQKPVFVAYLTAPEFYKLCFARFQNSLDESERKTYCAGMVTVAQYISKEEAAEILQTTPGLVDALNPYSDINQANMREASMGYGDVVDSE